MFEGASCVAIFITLLSVSILLFCPYRESLNRDALFIAAFIVLVIASVLACMSMRISQRSRYNTTHNSERTYLGQEEETVPLWRDVTIAITDTLTLKPDIARGIFSLLVLVVSLILLAFTVYYLLF
ncbi:hypothetical protein BSAE_1755 [Bifidobacterium pullorum subsp. saeculare DSM 6531 = LMG 14934]|uniref:Uncharacterized protein n=2 Tax=Bifidobacterium pullorum TaxID=78448 RepID=A0A087CXX0_9BIFI|nr:hypothetical protein BSAE_1755 [Bifidobacterium pullorum subsp. saeculare DSM 6531 = LMG 14934]